MVKPKKAGFRLLNSLVVHSTISLFIPEDEDSIEGPDAENTEGIDRLDIDPKGYLNEKERQFQLQLTCNVKTQDYEANVVIIGNFGFEQHVSLKTLENYFYINSSAILFPYLRAYLSSLTSLSGYKTLTLPLLNLSGLGDTLRKNTEKIT